LSNPIQKDPDFETDLQMESSGIITASCSRCGTFDTLTGSINTVAVNKEGINVVHWQCGTCRWYNKSQTTRSIAWIIKRKLVKSAASR